MVQDFIALDCETRKEKDLTIKSYYWTGEPKEFSYRQRIVSIGIAIVRNGKIIKSQNWFVKPNKEIEDFQINCNVTNDEIASGKSFPIVWDEIKKIIGNLPIFSASTSEIGYFNNEWERYNLECEKPIITNGTDEPLEIMALKRGIINKNAHNSESDAITLAQVLFTKETKISINSTSKLIGKTICFHGIGDKSKNYLKTLCNENGIKVISAPSNKMDILVAFDNKETGKVQKAKELQKQIITGQEFLIALFE